MKDNYSLMLINHSPPFVNYDQKSQIKGLGLVEKLFDNFEVSSPYYKITGGKWK